MDTMTNIGLGGGAFRVRGGAFRVRGGVFRVRGWVPLGLGCGCL